MRNCWEKVPHMKPSSVWLILSSKLCNTYFPEKTVPWTQIKDFEASELIFFLQGSISCEKA